MTFDTNSVEKLYFEGYSASEIGRMTQKTAWQVIRLMRKSGIKRRSSAETQRLQFLRKPLSFKINEHPTDNEQLLKISGLLLYWAEGAKRGEIVDLANSDEKIVLIFLKMLRTLYRVDEARLRVLLYSYSNQNQTELINYWSKLLIIPVIQFTKPYIRQDFRLEKLERMPKGMVHIRYNDQRLLKQIIKDIGIISNSILND